MMTIWKFDLMPEVGESIVEMPAGAKIIHVNVQDEYIEGTDVTLHHPRIWAVVDPNAPLVKCHFRVCVTGNNSDLPLGAAYVGTYHIPDYHLVFHVFFCGEERT